MRSLPSIYIFLYLFFAFSLIHSIIQEHECYVLFSIIYDIKNTMKVSKGAKIRNRYNQVPHLTKDTNGKVTNSQ